MLPLAVPFRPQPTGRHTDRETRSLSRGRHLPLGTLLAAGATRAELERIIAIDRQALRLGRVKLAGLSGRVKCLNSVEHNMEAILGAVSGLRINCLHCYWGEC